MIKKTKLIHEILFYYNNVLNDIPRGHLLAIILSIQTFNPKEKSISSDDLLYIQKVNHTEFLPIKTLCSFHSGHLILKELFTKFPDLVSDGKIRTTIFVEIYSIEFSKSYVHKLIETNVGKQLLDDYLKINNFYLDFNNNNIIKNISIEQYDVPHKNKSSIKNYTPAATKQNIINYNPKNFRDKRANDTSKANTNNFFSTKINELKSLNHSHIKNPIPNKQEKEYFCIPRFNNNFSNLNLVSMNNNHVLTIQPITATTILSPITKREKNITINPPIFQFSPISQKNINLSKEKFKASKLQLENLETIKENEEFSNLLFQNFADLSEFRHKMLIELSKLDDREAMYELAIFLLEGTVHLPKNTELAICYLHKVSEKNYPLADYQLGKIYYQGLIAKKDLEKAAYHIKRCAKYENPNGLYAYAKMLEKGEGVTKDMELALLYYQKAAKLGNEYAIQSIKRLSTKKINIDKEKQEDFLNTFKRERLQCCNSIDNDYEFKKRKFSLEKEQNDSLENFDKFEDNPCEFLDITDEQIEDIKETLEYEGPTDSIYNKYLDEIGKKLNYNNF